MPGDLLVSKRCDAAHPTRGTPDAPSAPATKREAPPMRSGQRPAPPSLHRRRTLGAVVAVCAVAATALAAAPAAQGAATPVEINLVTVNDFHGRIEQSAPAGGIAAL